MRRGALADIIEPLSSKNMMKNKFSMPYMRAAQLQPLSSPSQRKLADKRRIPGSDDSSSDSEGIQPAGGNKL